MNVEPIRKVCHAAGPFVTLYLERASPARAADQPSLRRWNELRESLITAGAAPSLLRRIGDTLRREPALPGDGDGRVLVANDAGVLLDQAWDAALECGDHAHFSGHPELGFLVRERARSVRLLVVIADRHGALVQRVVAVPAQVGPSRTGQQRAAVGTVGPAAVATYRTAGGARRQIQRRRQETVDGRLRHVTSYLERMTRQWEPDLVVLCGVEAGRATLRTELDTAVHGHYLETDHGTVQSRVDMAQLAQELGKMANRIGRQREELQGERFEIAVARERAISGADDVARAARMGAIGTLLLEYDHPAEHEAALLSATFRSGGSVEFTDTAITDGVAALLRCAPPARDAA